MSKIYVASSWRNVIQPEVVNILRGAGHIVYDFRNPTPENTGFSWSQIDPEWLDWTPRLFAHALVTDPIAADGYAFDKDALEWCDTCVMVLPCGRSAHLEAGYACGQGKRVVFYLHPDKFEPELMYLLGTALVTTASEMLNAVEGRPTPFETLRQQPQMSVCETNSERENENV